MGTTFGVKTEITQDIINNILATRYFLKDKNGKPIEDVPGMMRRIANYVTSKEDDNEFTQRIYDRLMNYEFLPNSPTIMNSGKENGQLNACFVLPVDNTNGWLSIYKTLHDMAIIHKTGGGTGFNFTNAEIEVYKTNTSNVFFLVNDQDHDFDHIKQSIDNLNDASKFCKYRVCSDIKDYLSRVEAKNAAHITITDNMDSIFSFNKLITNPRVKTADNIIIDFTKVRPKDSIITTTGGKASGPESFITVWINVIEALHKFNDPIDIITLYNEATETVKQGGTRRGANMGCLDIDSKYIEKFITCKTDTSKINNFNLSIAVTDEFMSTIDTDEENSKLFDLIVKQAWLNGEPGLLFIDEINKNNYTSERIVSTNPCGEEPLLAYESCNLASINLTSCLTFDSSDMCILDFNKLADIVRDVVRFLDCVIDVNHFPISIIDKNTKKYRKIGLGVMGLADTLYALGLVYGSDESLTYVDYLMSIINTTARDASIKLADSEGIFPGEISDDSPLEIKYSRNLECTTIAPTGTISTILGVSNGIEPQFMLSYVRSMATGEKLFSTNKYFINAMERYNYENPTTMIDIDDVLSHIHNNSGSVVSYKGFLPDKIKKIFVVASDISPRDHVRMLSTVQKNIDAGVSKTINMPCTATIDDVKTVFRTAFEKSCKGCTVYRDGSRSSQVLVSVSDDNKKLSGLPENNDKSETLTKKEMDYWALGYAGGPLIADNSGISLMVDDEHSKGLSNDELDMLENCTATYNHSPSQPCKKDRGYVLSGSTYKFHTGCGKLYITVNHDADGNIVEVFTPNPKHGGCPSQTEANTRLISTALQFGVPFDKIVSQIKGIRCHSATRNPKSECLSCPDAIAKALLAEREALNNTKAKTVHEQPKKPYIAEKIIATQSTENCTTDDDKTCPDCGAQLYRNGGSCSFCAECGYSHCNN